MIYGNKDFLVVTRQPYVTDTSTFQYRPEEDEPLSIAVVSAVAQAHHEEVIHQNWIINNDINPDALDGLFQSGHLNMTLTFEADSTTVTIDADEEGAPVIDIESHR